MNCFNEPFLIDSDIKAVVIQTNESKDYYLNKLNLDNNELVKYQSLTEKRKFEFLGIRYAFQLLGINETIKYKASGKPFIDSKNISISHSYKHVAVVVSDKTPIGIDIERHKPTISKIGHKFIRKDEQDFVDKENEVDYLHFIWGIKEGLYKIDGGENVLSFIKDLRVFPFKINHNEIIHCRIEHSENKYIYHCKAYYKKIDDFYLVVVYKNIF